MSNWCLYHHLYLPIGTIYATIFIIMCIRKNKGEMKKKYRFVIKVLLCLGLSIALGFFLLIFVYLLPTERMKKNVEESSEQIISEGGYYQWAKGYKNAQTDTYTDASLILNAMYHDSENVLADAMNVPRVLYGDDNNEESVVLYARGEQGDTHIVQYGRYWHGSLVLLKPMLLVFNLADIRVISMIVQMALLFCVVAGFVKRNLMTELLGFFAAIILLNPITMTMGFCFSVEYILMLIATGVVLFWHESLETGYRYCYFFLINGIVFVYFNELSFPMIGLGIPLVVFLLLSKEKICEKVKEEILYTVMWGIGYSVMWIGKWVLAWLLTGFNYFKEAIEQAARYTSDHATWETENPSVADRIVKNIDVYLKWPYALLGIAVIAVIVIFILRNRKNMSRENMLNMIAYLFPVLLPFALFIALGNGYSYVHYWFTHRLLSISVFADICMVLQLVKEKDNRNEADRLAW